MSGVLSDRAAVALASTLFIVLEVLSRTRRSYWFLFAVFLAGLVAGTVAALREDRRSRGPQVIVLPVAYVLGVLLFHLIVPRTLVQHLYSAGVSAGFLLLIARATEWAYPTWTWLFTSVTFFLFVAGAYGLTFHLRFPLWATALAVAAITAALTYAVVGRATPERSRRLFWSTLIALFLVELLVVLALLPLSYAAVGGALFVAFYLLLHLLQKHLYGELAALRVWEYLGVASAALVLILATAEWGV